MWHRREVPVPARDVSALAVACACCAALLACAAPDAAHETLADRYAREETRLIDVQSFEHARERSRSGFAERPAGSALSAAPLPVDLAQVRGWQFGTLAHPLDGELRCAAVSGLGEPAPAAGEPAPRLVVLADAAFVIVMGETPLAADAPEAAVRIDAGLPIPLEVRPGAARVATLRVAQDTLLGRLRAGATASLRLVARSTDDGASDASTGREIERVIALDGLGPMLDELGRCADAPPARQAAAEPNR